jgi:signal transduction histidine kinase/CheY-like chemotaxis protein
MNRSILTMEIRSEQDVVFARQRVRQLAGLLGFDSQDQTRLATALSEIARNAFKYAGGGKVDFSLEEEAPQRFLVRIRDQGPGIAELETILGGRYQSATGMGLGIIGSKRIMDEFAIDTHVGQGTQITFGKVLPKRASPVTLRDLGTISEELAKRFPPNPFEELQQQNQELLRALDQVNALNQQLANANQELEDTNRGVVALYAELDEKADYLQRANEIKTRFLSNMTHEFRTPLNSTLSLSKLLLDQVDGPLNPEQRKQVSFIRRSAEDLSELVNDLLDLAKIAAGKVVIRPTEFRVDELFGALRGMLKPLLAANASVNLVFDDPVDVTVLETDEGKVSQILRNFISNALKYTESGEVRVSARRAQDDTVVFAVADTGIGIAAQDQERIFEEFTQIESPLQSQTKGTGLGLPLSRKLAGLLGGSVELKSEPGRGSTFYAILPAVYRGPEEASYVPELNRKLDSTRVPVLVIEDNLESLFIYDKMLKGAGFQVIPARTLKEARLAVNDIRPAAIISDVLLEAESAWGFLAELKASEDTRHLPLIVVTMVDNERKARQLGADAFHAKPVEAEWLVARLRELTAARRPQKILIIDDDDIARYILRGMLAHSRYPILESANATEGLRRARAEHPSVVFLDLSMPDMTGFEALRALKADPETSAIPVIINTSKILTEKERETLEAEAFAVISKETQGTREQAVTSLRTLLERAHADEPGARA